MFYTRLDDAWRPAPALAAPPRGDPADDVLVHQEADERYWIGVSGSRDDRFLVIGLGSKTTSEVHVLDADDPEGAGGCWHPAARAWSTTSSRPQTASSSCTTPTPRTPTSRGRRSTRRARAVGAVARLGRATRYVSVDAFDAASVLSQRTGGLTPLRVLPDDPDAPSGHGDPWDVVVDHAVHSIGLGGNPSRASAPSRWSSTGLPSHGLDFDVATRELTLLRRQPVLGDFDAANYDEHRVWATAPDGTPVPVSVVRRIGVAPDGTSPGVLTAYGSYEISFDPYFSVARLCLLDRGVVYAVAHVRGGGEMGRRWYDDGKLFAKTNTFTDFVAAVATWSPPGGPLRTASARRRHCRRAARRRGAQPGARAVPGGVAAVPFVDVLTTMLQPDLPLTVTEWEEWGNPVADPEVYAAMRAYAPYENVRAVATRPCWRRRLHDTRVYVTSRPSGSPGCARRSRATRRSGPCCCAPSSRPATVGAVVATPPWEQIAWEWAFVLDQLGATERLLTVPAPTSSWALRRLPGQPPRHADPGVRGGQRVISSGQWQRLIRRSAVEPTCSPAKPPDPRLPTTSMAAPSRAVDERLDRLGAHHLVVDLDVGVLGAPRREGRLDDVLEVGLVGAPARARRQRRVARAVGLPGVQHVERATGARRLVERHGERPQRGLGPVDADDDAAASRGSRRRSRGPRRARGSGRG